MKFILLSVIKIYWYSVPANKRRKCIFNKSCSNHVYETIIQKGLFYGLKELKFRILNCRNEFDIFTDYKTGAKKMILKSGVIIDEEQIAEILK